MAHHRTQFTDTENRAFRRGRHVEFKDSERWLRGVVTHRPQLDGGGCEYILVKSRDVSTRNVANGEIVEARPGRVRTVD